MHQTGGNPYEFSTPDQGYMSAAGHVSESKPNAGIIGFSSDGNSMNVDPSSPYDMSFATNTGASSSRAANHGEEYQISMDSGAFYNTYYTGHEELNGTASISGSMNGSMSTPGPASSFLQKNGLGWMLEAADDDIGTSLSLLEELDIDITDIYYKIRCILLPLPYFRMKLNLVRESPDFWGPLGVVLLFAFLSLFGQISVVSWILTMWFCGSFMVFFITRALGGDVSYSQVLGIIGYCLIPLAVTGFLSSCLFNFPVLASILGLFGVVWSVYSAGTLLCAEDLQTKKPLVLYPVCLLYIYFYSLYSGV